MATAVAAAAASFYRGLIQVKILLDFGSGEVFGGSKLTVEDVLQQMKMNKSQGDRVIKDGILNPSIVSESLLKDYEKGYFHKLLRSQVTPDQALEDRTDRHLSGYKGDPNIHWCIDHLTGLFPALVNTNEEGQFLGKDHRVLIDPADAAKIPEEDNVPKLDWNPDLLYYYKVAREAQVASKLGIVKTHSGHSTVLIIIPKVEGGGAGGALRIYSLGIVSSLVSTQINVGKSIERDLVVSIPGVEGSVVPAGIQELPKVQYVSPDPLVRAEVPKKLMKLFGYLYGTFIKKEGGVRATTVIDRKGEVLEFINSFMLRGENVSEMVGPEKTFQAITDGAGKPVCTVLQLLIAVQKSVLHKKGELQKEQLLAVGVFNNNSIKAITKDIINKQLEFRKGTVFEEEEFGGLTNDLMDTGDPNSFIGYSAGSDIFSEPEAALFNKEVLSRNVSVATGEGRSIMNCARGSNQTITDPCTEFMLQGVPGSVRGVGELNVINTMYPPPKRSKTAKSGGGLKRRRKSSRKQRNKKTIRRKVSKTRKRTLNKKSKKRSKKLRK